MIPGLRKLNAVAKALLMLGVANLQANLEAFQDGYQQYLADGAPYGDDYVGLEWWRRLRRRKRQRLVDQARADLQQIISA